LIIGNISLKGSNLSPSVLAKNKRIEVFRLVSATKGQTFHQKSCPVQDQLLKEVALQSKVSNGLPSPCSVRRG